MFISSAELKQPPFKILFYDIIHKQ